LNISEKDVIIFVVTARSQQYDIHLADENINILLKDGRQRYLAIECPYHITEQHDKKYYIAVLRLNV